MTLCFWHGIQCVWCSVQQSMHYLVKFVQSYILAQDGLAGALITLLLDISGDVGAGPEFFRCDW